MQNLKEVIFSITNRCNLRCKMCDIPQERVEELSTEQWKKVIKDASRLGAQTIVFSGGEPLLREDIFELISFAKKNNLNACITSNGCLINEQTALRLFESGVNVVNISVEGSKEAHDLLRGEGSFEKAVSALANLKKFKIESTVAATVSKLNYAELLYVLEIAKEYGVTTVRLQPFNRIFLKDYSRENCFLIDKQDIHKVENIINKFAALAKEYKISTNPINYLLRIPAYLTGERLNPDKCIALWYSCPINPNGDVFPCWVEASNDKIIGNVREGGLYELWFSKKRMALINSILNKGCQGCMMSCYDEVFGQELLKEYMFNRAKKMKKIINYRKIINKILQSLKSEVVKLRLRCRFYASYRGSFLRVFRRRLAHIFNKPSGAGKNAQEKTEFILSEINKAKTKLRKEINSL